MVTRAKDIADSKRAKLQPSEMHRLVIPRPGLGISRHVASTLFRLNPAISVDAKALK